MDTDPVEQYYRDKKRRYLENMREAARTMTTGTPHDWADARRYLEDAGLEDDAPPGADDQRTD